MTTGSSRSLARPNADGTGVVVFLHVKPGARREGIEGTVTEADGGLRLKIAVAAPPEDGRANRAVAALLAAACGVPKSAVTVQSGASGRLKTVLIKGDPATILARVLPPENHSGE